MEAIEEKLKQLVEKLDEVSGGIGKNAEVVSQLEEKVLNLEESLTKTDKRIWIQKKRNLIGNYFIWSTS